MSDTAYQHLESIQSNYTIPPWGTSDISTHCVGYIQYRAEPKQVEAGVVVGEIQLRTLQRVCVRWKVLNGPISVCAFDWTTLAVNL